MSFFPTELIEKKLGLSYNHKLSIWSILRECMTKKGCNNTRSDQGKSNDNSSDLKDISTKSRFHPLLFDNENYNHADFLLREGQKKLTQGDSEGLKLFSLAITLDPQNHELIYEQGLALLRFGTESKSKKYLLLANKRFKMTTKLYPEMSSAWGGWGKSLFVLGQLFNEFHYFLNAKEKYEKAIALDNNSVELSLAQMHWDYGQVLTHIAYHSGESSDLNQALDAHAKASSHSEDLPAAFWEDYGIISLKLGEQINDIRLYLKAINCHKNAIRKSISNFKSWYLLAYSLSQLYTLTHDEDHFCQANECFTSAAKLQPQNETIWYSWAKLLLNSGIRISDAKRLHSCIEKCHRAHACKQDQELVMETWAIALASLGIISDRLDLIFEANNKVMEAIDHFSATPNLLHAEGRVQFAFGKYYKDNDYFYQAIEKFQEGLSIDRSKDFLWYHLGYTYALLAEEESDPTLYERAGKFFVKAISLTCKSSYFYEYACSLAKLAEVEQDKGILQQALLHFEQAFNLQKNAVYLHPRWLFKYAMALDLMGDLADEDKYYVKSIEILKRVLMLEPDFPDIHYKIAYVYSHLGELIENIEIFERASSHFKIAYQSDEENELLILDWALSLINLAHIIPDATLRNQKLREAEYKLVQSAKLGNVEAYYHLACLYSITTQFERAMYFLKKAENFDSLPPIDDVLGDDWLENLRNTDIFRDFIAHLR